MRRAAMAVCLNYPSLLGCAVLQTGTCWITAYWICRTENPYPKAACATVSRVITSINGLTSTELPDDGRLNFATRPSADWIMSSVYFRRLGRRSIGVQKFFKDRYLWPLHFNREVSSLADIHGALPASALFRAKAALQQLWKS